ncbi:MAG: MerR family transcriptional regulator [Bacteroidales bacterium]|nr:MerR family transcriptional regulator [Bacteroidales bacterium]
MTPGLSMPYKPHRIKKLYYSISEVAAMFDVNASLIRFWEKEFDILRPTKNKKGNRLFTQEDVENIYLIYHLVKERGFTLEGARNQLGQNYDEVQRRAQVSQSLSRIRGFLEEIDRILAGEGKQ